MRSFLGLAVLGLCLAGIALHLTVRDALPFPLFVAFYALPRPVLAAGLVFSALLSRGVSPRTARSAFGMAMGVALWSIVADCAWRGVSISRKTGNLRIAVWNCQGHPDGWSHETRLPVDWIPVTAEIESWNADLIGLVECGEGRNSSREDWESRFPGYEAHHPGTGLVILVRGRILDHQPLSLGHGGRAIRYDVEIGGRQLSCVLVDVASSLRIPRDEAMRKLSAFLAGMPDRATLILGDFNMPLESKSLDLLRREGCREAFQTAGQGYAPTWPSPVPVLTLDQIWGNPRVRFLRCERGWTGWSDHRPVFAAVATP